jgi:hypothetical protein
MMRTVGVPVLAGVLVAMSARDAYAEGSSCSQVAIEADASIVARSPELPKRVRDTFTAREDVERCARISLTFQDGMIDVDVVLPDGRSAHRSVSRREDVVPALEALLIVPAAPPTRAEPSSSSAAASRATATPAIATSALSTAPAMPSAADLAAAMVMSVPGHEGPTSMPAEPASHLGIELSVWTGARIGDGQAGLGLGALSFLDMAGWLVGFAGRADRFEPLGGAHPGAALELVLMGGRRLRIGTMALDLVAGPAVALGGTTTYNTQSPMGGGLSASASNTVPRLLIEARLAFAALSTVHTFVAVDGDFGPAGSPDASLLPNAHLLPIWTAGLALGATVGTR